MIEESELNATCIVQARNVVGECPLWHPEHNSIYWTDINRFLIQRYELENAAVTIWRFDEPVCTLSLTTNPDLILVALASRLIIWNPSTDQRVEFASPDPDWPFNRLNDGATGPNGMFWVGSMRNNVSADGQHVDVTGLTGSLYRVSSDGQVTVWDSGYGITNTLLWSPDEKTFYCGCSIQNAIYAYDYNAGDGSIDNRRIFAANMPHGVPDGSAIDTEGFIWNCRFYGGCILRYSPSGELVARIPMPASNVTNCTFGGADLRTLYVTTASLMTDDSEPLAGGLFAIPTDVQGSVTGSFRLPVA